MTRYEILSLCVSIIAALIALVVWLAQRKLARESNDMQRATAELAKKQLQILLKEEVDSETAHLALDLVRDGNSFRFVITNVGSIDAFDVDLQLVLADSASSPIIESEYKQKLPAKVLNPTSSVSLIAALHLGSPTAYNAKLSWKNPNGTVSETETYVAL